MGRSPKVAILKTILVALGLVLPLAPQAETASLGSLVHSLPDLTGKARSQRIREILARKDGTRQNLVAACTALPEFPPVKPGLSAVAPGWLHIPSGYTPTRRWPLVIAVGATGQPAKGTVSMWAPLCGRDDYLVLAPLAPKLGTGWTFAQADWEIVLKAYRWALRNLPIVTDRVFIAGYSRGGHAAWGMAGRHPGLFAGAIPAAGGPRVGWGKGQNNIRYLENLVAIGVYALVGARDDPLLVWNAREASARLKKWGADMTLEVKQEAGHVFALDPTRVSTWLNTRSRDPAPNKLVYVATEPGRCAWLRIVTLDRKYKGPFKPRVSAKEWQALSREGQRRRIIDLISKGTARVEARITGPGRLSLTTRGVRKISLLAGPSFPLGDEKGYVQISAKGRKPLRKRVVPSRSTLLREWARLPDPSLLVWAKIDLRCSP